MRNSLSHRRLPGGAAGLVAWLTYPGLQPRGICWCNRLWDTLACGTISINNWVSKRPWPTSSTPHVRTAFQRAHQQQTKACNLPSVRAWVSEFCRHGYRKLLQGEEARTRLGSGWRREEGEEGPRTVGITDGERAVCPERCRTSTSDAAVQLAAAVHFRQVCEVDGQFHGFGRHQARSDGELSLPAAMFTSLGIGWQWRDRGSASS